MGQSSASSLWNGDPSRHVATGAALAIRDPSLATSLPTVAENRVAGRRSTASSAVPFSLARSSGDAPSPPTP